LRLDPFALGNVTGKQGLRCYGANTTASLAEPVVGAADEAGMQHIWSDHVLDELELASDPPLARN
jgi:hypothetical protein